MFQQLKIYVKVLDNMQVFADIDGSILKKGTQVIEPYFVKAANLAYSMNFPLFTLVTARSLEGVDFALQNSEKINYFIPVIAEHGVFYRDSFMQTSRLPISDEDNAIFLSTVQEVCKLSYPDGVEIERKEATLQIHLEHVNPQKKHETASLFLSKISELIVDSQIYSVIQENEDTVELRTSYNKADGINKNNIIQSNETIFLCDNLGDNGGDRPAADFLQQKGGNIWYINPNKTHNDIALKPDKTFNSTEQACLELFNLFKSMAN